MSQEIAAPRRRGRPPRINLSMVLDAARDVLPTRLTVQLVSDRLGVHRNAINYLVGGKDGLLRLLAEDALLHRPAPDTNGLDSWVDLLHEYGVWLREHYAGMGELPDYLPCDVLIDPIESRFVTHITDALQKAGFSDETCRRAVCGVSVLAAGYSHAVRLVASLAPNSMPLDGSGAKPVSLIPEQGAVKLPTLDPEQFEFMLDTYISGLKLENANRPNEK